MQAAGTTTLLCCRQCCRVARLQQSATMGRQLLLPPLATHSCLTLEHQYAAAAAAAKAARKSRQSVRAASLYTSRLVDAAADVPVPLCRRSPQHTDQLASLMQWRDSVLQQVESIGEGFAAADGGPGAAELQREVTWVLDDVVAAWRERDAQQWQPCTWQQLQLELAAAHRRQQQTRAWQVQLRAAVGDLQELWQLRLRDRVPFQYVLHTAHWRDLVLAVGPGILVPRPETELLIDLAAAALAHDTTGALAAAPWADLGTGSGALAIGLARLLLQHRTQQPHGQQQQQQQQQQPAVLVFAVDLSPAAAAYAAANAAAHGVSGEVTVLQGSWCEPLHAALGAPSGGCGHPKQLLGGLVSNPPYIPRRQLAAGLQAEVAAHEPVTALDGGEGDGMDSLAALCRQAVPLLAPGAFIGLETAGAEQAPLVQQLLQELADGGGGGAAFCDVRVHDDCYGVPRFVTATRC